MVLLKAKGDATQSKHLVRNHVPRISRAEYNNLRFV